ncbi:hypothetical protein ACHQM5_030404 [Ranunculus cassubicifolius]
MSLSSTKRSQSGASMESNPGDGKTEVKNKLICLICMKENDHASFTCPLKFYCSPRAKVGPDVEVLCFCCGEDVHIAHPGEGVVGGRARIKNSYWRKPSKSEASAPKI